MNNVSLKDIPNILTDYFSTNTESRAKAINSLEFFCEKEPLEFVFFLITQILPHVNDINIIDHIFVLLFRPIKIIYRNNIRLSLEQLEILKNFFDYLLNFFNSDFKHVKQHVAVLFTYASNLIKHNHQDFDINEFVMCSISDETRYTCFLIFKCLFEDNELEITEVYNILTLLINYKVKEMSNEEKNEYLMLFILLTPYYKSIYSDINDSIIDSIFLFFLDIMSTDDFKRVGWEFWCDLSYEWDVVFTNKDIFCTLFTLSKRDINIQGIEVHILEFYRSLMLYLKNNPSEIDMFIDDFTYFSYVIFNKSTPLTQFCLIDENSTDWDVHLSATCLFYDFLDAIWDKICSNNDIFDANTLISEIQNKLCSSNHNEIFCGLQLLVEYTNIFNKRNITLRNLQQFVLDKINIFIKDQLPAFRLSSLKLFAALSEDHNYDFGENMKFYLTTFIHLLNEDIHEINNIVVKCVRNVYFNKHFTSFDWLIEQLFSSQNHDCLCLISSVPDDKLSIDDLLLLFSKFDDLMEHQMSDLKDISATHKSQDIIISCLIFFRSKLKLLPDPLPITRNLYGKVKSIFCQFRLHEALQVMAQIASVDSYYFVDVLHISVNCLSSNIGESILFAALQAIQHLAKYDINDIHIIINKILEILKGSMETQFIDIKEVALDSLASLNHKHNFVKFIDEIFVILDSFVSSFEGRHSRSDEEDTINLYASGVGLISSVIEVIDYAAIDDALIKLCFRFILVGLNLATSELLALNMIDLIYFLHNKVGDNIRDSIVSIDGLRDLIDDCIDRFGNFYKLDMVNSLFC